MFYAFLLIFFAHRFNLLTEKEKNMGSLLSSFSFLSMGGSVLGVTFSLLLATIMLALWALVLMVLHPLHATMFVLAALCEYVLISLFGFSLWFDFIAFFMFYILIFGTYTLLLRRWLPLPHTEIEQLLKLAKLKEDGMLTDDEYKAAKKRLLKI